MKTKNERLVEDRVGDDLKDHVVTVIRCDGMHRHYRCQKPGTWNMGFDVVTWPGSLCYTGDMGDYLFQRTEDMIAFMRGSAMSYGYAAEKCVAHDGRLEEFSEEIFEQVLAERIKDFEGEGGKATLLRNEEKRQEDVAEIIDDIRQQFKTYSAPFDAERAMFESGLWDGCDLPSCETWTFHFLWALHAIKWFCDKVDRGDVKGAKP